MKEIGFIPPTQRGRGVVYRIVDPIGRSYIGSTGNLRRRINEHKRETERGSIVRLYCEIRHFGWKNMTVEAIAVGKLSEMRAVEAHIIRARGLCDGRLGFNRK